MTRLILTKLNSNFKFDVSIFTPSLELIISGFFNNTIYSGLLDQVYTQYFPSLTIKDITYWQPSRKPYYLVVKNCVWRYQWCLSYLYNYRDYNFNVDKIMITTWNITNMRVYIMIAINVTEVKKHHYVHVFHFPPHFYVQKFWRYVIDIASN